MSYLSPLNPPGIDFDRPYCSNDGEVSPEDDSPRGDVEREPGIDGRFKGESAKIQSFADERRELRRRDGCAREEDDVELEPEPRKLLL
jgi:hypothetical protein